MPETEIALRPIDEADAASVPYVSVAFHTGYGAS